MKKTTDFNEKLFKFYLGSLDDDERTEVEDDLLGSKETLTEYIALKRTFEMDETILEPSRAFQQRLRRMAQQKFVRERQSFFKIWIPVGAFALVVLVVFGVFKMKAVAPTQSVQGSSGISFDSSGEAPVSLSVL